MNTDSFSRETQQQAAVFDQIGEEYEKIYGINTNQISAVRWLLERLPPSSNVVDIGSGTGVPTARMLTDAGHSVIGIDISTEMLQIAKRQVPQATFFQMDAAKLTFDPASFHAITAFFSLLMLSRDTIESTLQQLKTLLKSPGYFVLSMIEGDYDYREVHFLGQSVHVSAYPRDRLFSLLKDLSFNVLDSDVVQFQANEQARIETQLFFFCQYQA